MGVGHGSISAGPMHSFLRGRQRAGRWEWSIMVRDGHESIDYIVMYSRMEIITS